MEFCALNYVFLATSVIFVFVGISHKIYEYLPSLIRDMVVYGKLLDKKKRTNIQQFLLVPKRWFLHFYTVSFFWNGMTLMFVVQYSLHGSPLPNWYTSLLNILTCYPVSPPSIDLLTVLIAMLVIVVQAARRVYECLCVSVYSTSNMHLSHYATGMFFYSAVGISVLSEGPQLDEAGTPQPFTQLVKGLQWHHVLGLLMFLWASWHHHKAHVIFANLRTGKKDANRHMVPRGDWFDYVSCPHYLAEILIYTSLAVILGGHHTLWWLVLAFVVSNQTIASLKVHRWYRAKFEDYPKGRKALIPFVL